MNNFKRAEALIIGLLLVGSIAYLRALPPALGLADESYFLYEAKRLRDGELLYRDVFQFVTPLSPYAMAGLYWLFGTDMATARTATAVIHGLIMLFTYGAARTLGVVPAFASLAAAAHLAINQPAWPFASWHWFSTLVASGLLLLLIRAPRADTRRRALLLGLTSGALIGVQQQRGLIPTVAVGLLLLTEGLLDSRHGCRRTPRSVLGDVVAFAAGVGVIVVPVLALFVLLAGFDAVFDALVRFPLESYRKSAPHPAWGKVTRLTAAYAAGTFPALLAKLPWLLLAPLALLLGDRRRIDAREHARRCLAITVFAAATVASIWYYNDFIHIAFIAPSFFVIAAMGAQWACDALPLRSTLLPSIRRAVAAAVLSAAALHLAANHRRAWQLTPYVHDTAFGRVAFQTQWEMTLVDELRTRLRGEPAPEIFCYANLAAPYLTTGAKNPTRFQHFAAWAFPAADVAQVVATLQERRVPYIVALLVALRPGDPIAELIERDYRLVRLPLAPDAKVPALWLYERKDKGGGETPAGTS